MLETKEVIEKIEDPKVNSDIHPGSGEWSLIDYYKIYRQNRTTIFIVTAIVGLISIFLFFFIIKPVYLSTTTVKTTAKASGLSGLIPEGIPDIGDLGGLGGGGGAITKELALYENILLSRRNIEETILKFNLMEDGEFKYMQDAVKNFRENVLEISKDKIAGTMTIGIYDNDPVKAKEMTDFMIYQLNRINTELNVLNAKNNKEFIQERYNVVSLDLSQAEDSLRIFQDVFGIAPDIQVQAALKAEVELEAEIRSEEVKLELLRKLLTSDQPEVKQQEDKINALKMQLNDIQYSTDGSSKLQIKGSPEKVLSFVRLKRNVEIQNKILTTLIPMLEQSKIEEKKETPTVLVLDPPNIPERKAKPKRLPKVLMFSFIGFVFSYIYFVGKSKWKNFKIRISH
jgi:capsule polysaccharide export protein KpsE/RkpR